jgi:hypothetical protein
VGVAAFAAELGDGLEADGVAAVTAWPPCELPESRTRTNAALPPTITTAARTPAKSLGRIRGR